MTRHALLMIAFSFALAATGCATIEADANRAEASDVEASLRSAGFVLIPSDTPQRIESMRTLPPLVFSQVERERGSYFVYADPSSCMCIWVGTIEEMQRFSELVSEEALGRFQGEVGIVEMQADLWDPDWAGIDD